MRWKVGNGKNIIIYRDQWLPYIGSDKTYSPFKLNAKACVSDLINDVRLWKESVIWENFLTNEANTIL